MTLLDLRRYAIRNSARISFTLDPAGDCVVNEHGVLKIPSLQSVPNYRLDTSLSTVEEFTLAPVKGPGRPRKISRQEMDALLGTASRSVHSDPEE